MVERKVVKDEKIERAKRKINHLLDTIIVSKRDLAEDTDVRFIKDSSIQIDLSKLDFALLREKFPEQKYKNIDFANLRELMEIKLKQMLAQNKTRGSFLANFQ